MQCKYHPDRVAEVFCTSCNGPVCRECAEEANTGEFYCYECAMLHYVSEVGTSIRDKWKREEEKRRERREEKMGPFSLLCSPLLCSDPGDVGNNHLWWQKATCQDH